MTDNQPEVSSTVQGLYDDVRKTARMRFTAHRRLLIHDKLAQWTIAQLSVVLILISLLQAFSATNPNVPSQVLNAIQAFLGVFILAFSLLVAKDDLAIKADRMHKSGLELNNLARKVRPYLHSSLDQSTYARLISKYDQLLSQSENHRSIDYHTYQLEQLLKKLKENAKGKDSIKRHSFANWCTYFWGRIKNGARHLGWLAPHLVVWIIVLAVVIYVVDIHVLYNALVGQ